MEMNFVDVDPTFHVHVDEDYDARSSGVSKDCFCRVYHDWIVYCAHSGHLVSERRFMCDVFDSL